jgi:hypothetical protein
MEAVDVFKAFSNDLQSAFPEIVTQVDLDTDKAVQHIEKDFFPHILKIVQKDESFFRDADRNLFGVNLSDVWNADGVSDCTKEAIWKHLQLCLIASFLHGDIKEKIGTIMSTMKTMWAGKDDEISKVLNDDSSKGHITAILDFILETRIVKVFMEIVQEIDISEFELDISNPQELIEIVKNPEHPVVKKIVTKLQKILQEKVQSGSITPQQLASEIEAIKAKLMSVFGNAFSEALGGTKSDVSASALLGSSPEARRQRMLARLQKKQRDKKSS